MVIYSLNLIKGFKNTDFDPKMVENIFEIICILTAAINYTNNFPDTTFSPDYCIPNLILQPSAGYYKFQEAK